MTTLAASSTMRGVAPARREVDTPAVGARLGEVAREAREVGGARAAPSVDRLVGVADGHDGVPARRAPRAGGSARRSCPGTRRAARSGSAFAVGGDDLGMPFADLECEGDLVGELHVAALALRRGIARRRGRAAAAARRPRPSAAVNARSRCACAAPRSADRPCARKSRANACTSRLSATFSASARLSASTAAVTRSSEASSSTRRGSADVLDTERASIQADASPSTAASGSRPMSIACSR